MLNASYVCCEYVLMPANHLQDGSACVEVPARCSPSLSGSPVCAGPLVWYGRQQLRSTASGTLLVPRARTATGQRSFAVNGSRTWNSLPADLRTPDTTLCSFKRHLKAHLFQQ